MLKDQNGIFFFDVSSARHPRFLLFARAVESSITDDFYPLPEGGFLITQMGSEKRWRAGPRGRIRWPIAFRGQSLRLDHPVPGGPAVAPIDGFNPHGIRFVRT